MRVLIASDSFKGSLGSLEVADMIEKGIRNVYSDAYVDKVAVADGGEGTVSAFAHNLGGEYIYTDVKGPLGETVRARYGIIHGNIAVIEMAEASGLCLVPEGKRNPLLTSTYGTGELIIDALSKGCRDIIIGIGGSATNDGGAGMAAALGVKFLDRDGNSFLPTGGSLGSVYSIDMDGISPDISNARITAACDVDIPLCGPRGASRVFAPQKGANLEMVETLDKNLQNYASVIKKELRIDIAETPGAGAAGGLGAGLMVFCGALFKNGIDLLLDTVNIDEKIRLCDIVITGEGRIDRQTAMGKAPCGIAKKAKMHGKPVFAIAGQIGDGVKMVYEKGIDSVISIVSRPMSLNEALQSSPELIEDAAERLFRVIHAMNAL
ncbi:MAG TPA: glycerate kinase [Clostridia bacterium]